MDVLLFVTEPPPVLCLSDVPVLGLAEADLDLLEEEEDEGSGWE